MNSNLSVTDGRGRSMLRLFSGTRAPSSVPGFPARARAAARAHSRLAAALRRHAHDGRRPPNYRVCLRLYRAPLPRGRSGATSRSPSSRLPPWIPVRSSSSVEAITSPFQTSSLLDGLSGSFGAPQSAGFVVVAERGGPHESFGNLLVVFERSTLAVRITRDRGQGSIELAPGRGEFVP